MCAVPSVVRKKLWCENEGLMKGMPPLIICHVKATNMPTEKIIKSTANPRDIPIRTLRYIKRAKPPSSPRTVSPGASVRSVPRIEGIPVQSRLKTAA